MSKPCKEEYVRHEVIENKILAAINDKATVACIFNEVDLGLVIKAIGGRPLLPKEKARCLNLVKSLEQLQAAVFPKP